MNRAELRDQLKFWLNTNPNQVDSNFSESNLNSLLQSAYKQLCASLQHVAPKTWFINVQDVVWPANQVELDLNSALSCIDIIKVDDVTSSSIGTPLNIGQYSEQNLVFWKTNSTLQWGTTGPSEDKTLRFVHLGTPETWSLDTQEPQYIPVQYHDVVALEAAVLARELWLERAPDTWYRRLEECKGDLMKYMSRARPRTDTSWIQPEDADEMSWTFTF